MFSHRHRRPPFPDLINWTDYRWDPNPSRHHSGPRPFGHHPHPRRGYGLLKVLLAGLAVVAGVKLMSSLRNGGNRSWVEKGILAVLLLMVASYVSKRAGTRRW
jgi:hypothetical protein